MQKEFELMREETFGSKNGIVLQIYAKNIDLEDREFSWKIILPNDKVIDWSECEDNCGDFVFETYEDAKDHAFDYYVDHSKFECELKTGNNFKAYKDADLLNLMDNPEDNVEEYPEDFELKPVKK